MRSHSKIRQEWRSARSKIHRLALAIAQALAAPSFGSLPLTALLLVAASDSRAENECGPGPTVTCTGASFPNGIAYQDGAADLDVTLTGTVASTTPQSSGVFGIGVIADTPPDQISGSLKLTVAPGASIFPGSGGWGILSKFANTSIQFSGQIESLALDPRGLLVEAASPLPGTPHINVGLAQDSGITVSDQAVRLRYTNEVAGNIGLTQAGAMRTTGAGSTAIDLHTENGMITFTQLASGRIVSAGIGVNLNVNSATIGSVITNAGAITADSIGLRFAADKVYRISNSGGITALNGTALHITGTSPAARISLDNSGSISGDLGVSWQSSGGALRHSGELIGSGGTAVAITGDSNLIHLSAGARISGDLNALGGNNSVTLENEGSYGGNIRGFSNLLKAPGAGTWRLDGNVLNNPREAAHILVNSGTLLFTGNLGGPLTRTTILTGATLQAGAGGNIGDLGGAIANNGTLIFDHNQSRTVAGDISGSGQVVQAGPGTTVLTGNGQHSGGTEIRAGTLQLGNGGGAGSVGGDIVNNGTLAISRSGDLTLSGTISGSGGLIQSGPGTTVLTANNTYTGLTQILSGTLQIGAGVAGTANGTIAGNIDNRSALIFSHGGGYTYGGTIAGDGNVTIADNSAPAGTTFIANHTYTGTTTISNGSRLTLGAGGSSGSVAGNIVDNGQLWINRSDTHVFGNAISGNGSLNIQGAGTTVLTAGNAYTGGTHIGAGTLQLGNGGVSGSIVGPVVVTAGATLSFDRSDTLGLAGAISGDGSVVQAGIGTTVLTGASTHTGGTVIQRGTLQLGDGGITGSLAGEIVNNGRLRINRSDQYVFNAVVSGTGGLAQAGTGTTVLTGNNTYSGHTLIERGTLQIGAGGNLGAVAGGIENRSRLIFSHGSDHIHGGAISGAGSVIIANRNDSGTVFTADQTYTGTTTIQNSAWLGLGNGGATGSLVGSIVNNGGLRIDRSDTHTFANAISGSGSLSVQGSGTTVLTANNTYSGSTMIGAGSLQLGDGGDRGGIAGSVTLSDASGRLVFKRSDEYAFGGAIQGDGGVVQAGTGTTLLTGTSAYTGSTLVEAGTLLVDGRINRIASTTGTSVSVAADATLGGKGFIDGTVTLADGAHLAPGSGGAGTLSIGGTLTLAPGALLDYDLGQPGIIGSGVNDLIEVGGNLVLDGTLNVNDLGGFGSPGVYRLITYGGALTDNGLDLGALPAGVDPVNYAIQTAVAKEVNLVASAGAPLQFWDGPNETANGAIDGGTAVWNTVSTNWTSFDGAINAGWASGFAVFQGTAGTVTLGEDIELTGMQFDTTGYRIEGNGFDLRADTTDLAIRVGTGMVATIDAGIVDGTAQPTQLRKTDAGVLILGGSHGYSGGTRIGGGVLMVSQDENLGAATGGVGIANGAVFSTTGSFASLRNWVLESGIGAISTAGNTTLTLDGTIDGAGTLAKIGAGTLVLNGDNRHTGGVWLNGGVLEIDSDAALGDATGALRFGGGNLRLGANVDFAAARSIRLDADASIETGSVTSSYTGTFNGALTGEGGLTKTGFGTLILAADNTYTGGTVIEQGLLQLGNGGTTGSVVGDILNNGVLRIRRSDTLVLDGAVSGTGSLVQDGPGTTVLAADNTYLGNTLVLAGALQIGTGGTRGNLTGDIHNQSTVVINHSSQGVFNGRIFGTGEVVFLAGIGERGSTTLLADQPYTGVTRIGPGADLILGSGGGSGSVGGAIENQGRLSVNRSDTHVFGNLISGGGSVNLLGTGTTVLTADNLYTGGTHVGAATLRLGNGGTSGSIFGVVELNDVEGELVFDRSDTATFSGRIAGAGGVTQAGTGTTVLATDHAYTGGTTIERGTLQIGDGGTSGRIIGDVVDHGTLAFDRSDAYTFAGTISGSGGLAQRGSGMLTLIRDHSFTGTTSIATGSTLQLGNGGGSGSVAGAIVDDGTLVFDHANDALISGAISGSGTVIKRGGNTLTLTGNNAYAGLTTIEGGLLRIGDGGASGAIAGDVANAGGLEFQRSGSLTYAGAISGTGYLRHAGTGTLTLSGDNRHSGGTYLDAGTLSVGADRNLGDAAGRLTIDGGMLRLSARFDSARPIVIEEGGATIEAVERNKLSGQITGNGGLTKTGAGALIFNDRASYLGITQVAKGILVVGDSAHPDAQLVGSGIDIAAGAAFGGYGRAFGVVRNFGTLGVGNALAALANEPDAEFTLVGNLFNAGIVTMVNAAAADRLIVNGAYQAAGGLLEMEAVLNEGGAATQVDRLQVQSVAVAGAPTGMVVHSLGGAGATTVDNGILLIDTTSAEESAAGAFMLARRVVAGPYEYLLHQGGVADPQDGDWYLRSTVLQEDPEEQPVPVYRPEVGVYLGNRQAATSALIQTLHDRLGEPQSAQASADDGAYLGAAWARMLGNDLRTEAANGLISAEGGRSLFQAGAEFARWRVFGERDRLHLGGMFGYARSDTRVEARFNPARARGDTRGTLAGVYATWFSNDDGRLGAYADAWAQYGRFDNRVRGDGVDQIDYDADAWAVSLEIGYAIGLGGWVIEPQAQVLYSDYASDVVLEVDGNRVESGDDGDMLARLGVRIQPRPEPGTGIRPFLQTDWWYGGGTPSFLFNGQRIESGMPDDRYTVKAGLEGLIGTNLALWMQLEREWGSDAYRGMRGQIGVKFSW